MPLSLDDRDRRITIERATITQDAMGGEVKAWAPFVQAWASVSFGTGQERRTAVQQSGSVPATFRILWNSTTSQIDDRDRIQFLGAAWDISSVVPFGLNEGVDITATRAA